MQGQSKLLLAVSRVGRTQHTAQHQVVALGLIYLILAGCAAQPSLGAGRQPDSLGQVFNIAVLPWATPARSSNDLILFFPVARRTTTTTLQGCPPILSSPNLTFRSWVRPLRLLHERHDALFFHPRARPALSGTTKPHLLELELQVARSYSSYCLLHADFLVYGLWIRPCRFLWVHRNPRSSTSPSDPTRRGGKGETREHPQRGLPCPRHGTPCLLCPPWHTRLLTYKAAKPQEQGQGEGGGSGLTG